MEKPKQQIIVLKSLVLFQTAAAVYNCACLMCFPLVQEGTADLCGDQR